MWVREYGSCNHIVVFDPDTGEVLEKPAGQGYAEAILKNLNDQYCDWNTEKDGVLQFGEKVLFTVLVYKKIAFFKLIYYN